MHAQIFLLYREKNMDKKKITIVAVVILMIVALLLNFIKVDGTENETESTPDAQTDIFYVFDSNLGEYDVEYTISGCVTKGCVEIYVFNGLDLKSDKSNLVEERTIAEIGNYEENFDFGDFDKENENLKICIKKTNDTTVKVVAKSKTTLLKKLMGRGL